MMILLYSSLGGRSRIIRRFVAKILYCNNYRILADGLILIPDISMESATKFDVHITAKRERDSEMTQFLGGASESL